MAKMPRTGSSGKRPPWQCKNEGGSAIQSPALTSNNVELNWTWPSSRPTAFLDAAACAKNPTFALSSNAQQVTSAGWATSGSHIRCCTREMIFVQLWLKRTANTRKTS